MKNDPLKDLFKEAFEKEDIPFDPAAWHQMNQLLNQQQRKNALWVGFSSGCGFALLTMLTMLVFKENTAIYQPRNGAFANTEAWSAPSDTNTHPPLFLPQEIPARQNNTIQIQTSGRAISSTVGKTTSSASIDEAISKPYDSLIAPTTIADLTTQGEGLNSNTSIKPINDTLSNILITSETTPISAVQQPHLSNQLPRQSSCRSSRKNINPIDRILFERTLSAANILESRIIQSPSKLNTPSQIYFRIGASRNFMLKTGQVGGLGYERQLVEHLLFSAELIIARDHTYFNHVQEQVRFGFDQYNTALRIWASEMLHAELPVLLRFRSNRITLGTGVSLGMLWSSAVIEELLESSMLSKAHKQAIGEQTEVGYVNWSAIRSLQIGIPVDLQYQIDERYAIGTRYQYGLRDAFAITPEMDRLHRLEFYLKMTLKP